MLVEKPGTGTSTNSNKSTKPSSQKKPVNKIRDFFSNVAESALTRFFDPSDLTIINFKNQYLIDFIDRRTIQDLYPNSLIYPNYEYKKYDIGRKKIQTGPSRGTIIMNGNKDKKTNLQLFTKLNQANLIDSLVYQKIVTLQKGNSNFKNKILKNCICLGNKTYKKDYDGEYDGIYEFYTMWRYQLYTLLWNLNGNAHQTLIDAYGIFTDEIMNSDMWKKFHDQNKDRIKLKNAFKVLEKIFFPSNKNDATRPSANDNDIPNPPDISEDELGELYQMIREVEAKIAEENAMDDRLVKEEEDENLIKMIDEVYDEIAVDEMIANVEKDIAEKERQGNISNILDQEISSSDEEDDVSDNSSDDEDDENHVPNGKVFDRTRESSILSNGTSDDRKSSTSSNGTDTTRKSSTSSNGTSDDRKSSTSSNGTDTTRKSSTSTNGTSDRKSSTSTNGTSDRKSSTSSNGTSVTGSTNGYYPNNRNDSSKNPPPMLGLLPKRLSSRMSAYFTTPRQTSQNEIILYIQRFHNITEDMILQNITIDNGVNKWLANYPNALPYYIIADVKYMLFLAIQFIDTIQSTGYDNVVFMKPDTQDVDEQVNYFLSPNSFFKMTAKDYRIPKDATNIQHCTIVKEGTSVDYNTFTIHKLIGMLLEREIDFLNIPLKGGESRKSLRNSFTQVNNSFKNSIQNVNGSIRKSGIAVNATNFVFGKSHFIQFILIAFRHAHYFYVETYMVKKIMNIAKNNYIIPGETNKTQHHIPVKFYDIMGTFSLSMKSKICSSAVNQAIGFTISQGIPMGTSTLLKMIPYVNRITRTPQCNMITNLNNSIVALWYKFYAKNKEEELKLGKNGGRTLRRRYVKETKTQKKRASKMRGNKTRYVTKKRNTRKKLRMK
jgi:hypothetical protein